MRIATWNVNSLKARLERVEDWLGAVQPDVVCLQETKLRDDAFPQLTFSGLGYDAVHVGEGGRNGVAILSRVGLDDVQSGFTVDPRDALNPDSDGEDARAVSATCDGVRVWSVYVPNGREPDHEQYHYKLGWLDRLRREMETLAPDAQPIAVCGDFNVSPEDRDVYDITKFADATHVTEAERGALQAVIDAGFTDVFRAQYPDAERVYTWWDYRQGMFHTHRGMRMDFVLASTPLASRATFALMDRNARKGKKPSDHAPVFADFDV